MENHSTFNIRGSTSKDCGGAPSPMEVRRSMLNVECSHWFLLNSGPCEAAFNMALDEALLEGVAALDAPVLRFYGWTQPAASFGYFQRHAEIERTTHLRPLVRRPTGGGLVPHDADWTYSVAFPTTHEWYSLAATESYQRVHEWICAAFARLDVATELASCCRKSAPGQCFVGYEKSDVLWQGRKIAGAAQRRTRAGLLIQGSVQPPSLQLAKADWQAALCVTAIGQWCSGWNELTLDGKLLGHAELLEETKYARAEYNQKR
jgi:lipoate-protein ligase A